MTKSHLVSHSLSLHTHIELHTRNTSNRIGKPNDCVLSLAFGGNCEFDACAVAIFKRFRLMRSNKKGTGTGRRCTFPFECIRMGKQQQLNHHTLTLHIRHANDLITKQNIFDSIHSQFQMFAHERTFIDQISANKSDFKIQVAAIYLMWFFSEIIRRFFFSLLFKSEECCISALCKLSQRHTK